MIIETVNESAFRDAFQRMGRTDQFSYEALGLLYDYLDQLSDDTGEPLELDVIGICCDYSEMTAEEVREAYGLDTPEDDDEAEEAEDVRDYLTENTSLVGETDSSFVFAQF